MENHNQTPLETDEGPDSEARVHDLVARFHDIDPEDAREADRDL